MRIDNECFICIVLLIIMCVKCRDRITHHPEATLANNLVDDMAKVHLKANAIEEELQGQVGDSADMDVEEHPTPANTAVTGNFTTNFRND